MIEMSEKEKRRTSYDEGDCKTEEKIVKSQQRFVLAELETAIRSCKNGSG